MNDDLTQAIIARLSSDDGRSQIMANLIAAIIMCCAVLIELAITSQSFRMEVRAWRDRFRAMASGHATDKAWMNRLSAVFVPTGEVTAEAERIAAEGR